MYQKCFDLLLGLFRTQIEKTRYLRRIKIDATLRFLVTGNSNKDIKFRHVLFQKHNAIKGYYKTSLEIINHFCYRQFNCSS